MSLYSNTYTLSEPVGMVQRKVKITVRKVATFYSRPWSILSFNIPVSQMKDKVTKLLHENSSRIIKDKSLSIKLKMMNMVKHKAWSINDDQNV